jgi:hypothetical protein
MRSMARVLLGNRLGEVMEKPFRTWTVLPHGKLTRLDDETGDVPPVVRMRKLDPN